VAANVFKKEAGREVNPAALKTKKDTPKLRWIPALE
jgi:hypothetical protein